MCAADRPITTPALVFACGGSMQGRTTGIGAVVGPTNFAEARSICQGIILISCHLLIASYHNRGLSIGRTNVRQLSPSAGPMPIGRTQLITGGSTPQRYVLQALHRFDPCFRCN